MSVILAIDRGKYNSVVCEFDDATGEVAFRTVKTTPTSLRVELTRLAIDRVVIEACSPAGCVHDLCCELGMRCEVANTAGAAKAWKNVKRKLVDSQVVSGVSTTGLLSRHVEVCLVE